MALRLARLVLAAVTVAALVTRALAPDTNLANLFSYFTYQSIIIAVVVLAVGGLVDPRDPRWAYFRGAATLYITITGLVSNTLLLGGEVDWVDNVVHRITPALMLLDWILFSPWARAHVVAALGWLGYLLAYLLYTMLRGPVVDWYPYPFLDPRLPGGYGRVAIYAVALAVAGALLAALINGVGRWRLTAARTAF